jgi:hypothetical protein
MPKARPAQVIEMKMKEAAIRTSSLRKNLGIGALTVLFASGFGAVGML